MTLAVDTDVLAHWAMAGTERHVSARALIEAELLRPDGRLALASQVVWEFLHVVTDARRFENPMPMNTAIQTARDLWDARDALRIMPSPRWVQRTLELMTSLNLGRKRILDTALAAALDLAGISRLATFNGRHFSVFPFIDVVQPS